MAFPNPEEEQSRSSGLSTTRDFPTAAEDELVLALKTVNIKSSVDQTHIKSSVDQTHHGYQETEGQSGSLFVSPEYSRYSSKLEEALQQLDQKEQEYKELNNKYAKLRAEMKRKLKEKDDEMERLKEKYDEMERKLREEKAELKHKVEDLAKKMDQLQLKSKYTTEDCRLVVSKHKEMLIRTSKQTVLIGLSQAVCITVVISSSDGRWPCGSTTIELVDHHYSSSIVVQLISLQLHMERPWALLQEIYGWCG